MRRTVRFCFPGLVLILFHNPCWLPPDQSPSANTTDHHPAGNFVTKVQLSSMRQKFRQSVQNYVVYYGQGQVNELRQFDAIIVDPKGYTVSERAQLRAPKPNGNRPILIGYLSCSEALPNDPILGQASPADYYRVNGVPERIPGSNAYVMDLRQNHWRQVLINQAVLLISKGFDGVFLDTLSIGENPHYAGSLGNAFLAAAGTLTHDLRARLQTHILIQNWGIERLKNYTASFLDGICWENFQVRFLETDQWTQNRLAELTQLRQNGLPILTLYRLTPTEVHDVNFQSKMYSTSRSYQFLPYCALSEYASGVNLAPLQAGF